MRILHLSDTHLGVHLPVVGAPAGWSRAADHAAAFDRALAPALQGEVDLVLHTGDLFDRSRPPPEAVDHALARFAEVSRVAPVVVMPGNHDRQGLRAHLSHPPPNVWVVDAPSTLRLAGLRLGVVPFERSPQRWAAAAVQAAAGGVDLLLCHQAFDGSRVPGYTFRPAPDTDTLPRSALPPDAPLILTGHIHTRQDLRLDGRRIIHVGSTERTSFVERGEAKGALLLDLPSGHHRWVDTQPRPMRFVRAPEDLDGLRPETLVALARSARTEEIEAAALSAGAWVQRWARPSRQAQLFPVGGEV